MTTPWPKIWPKITATPVPLGASMKFQRGADVLWLEERCFLTVKHGDSLSGYSKILYGNYGELKVWGRMLPECDGFLSDMDDLIPIANENLIKVGETLVHVPEFLDSLKVTLDEGGSSKPGLRTRKTPNVTLRGGMEIIASDFSWTDRAAVGEWATTGWSSGYVVLEDIPTFVDRVRQAAGNRPISLLHIQVHGMSGEMHFGYGAKKDVLTKASLLKYGAKLKELKFNLGSGAWVVVRSCQTGADLKLLRGLRDLWGVSILAGTGDWNNVYDFNWGQYVILEAGGAEYYVDRMPSQIQSSLMRKAWRNR